MARKIPTHNNVTIVVPVAYGFFALMYFVLTVILIPALVYHVVGALIALVSFMLWITARAQLGSAFSIKPRVSFLVTTGLYAKFRHPIYYFSTSALIGINIFMWSFFITPLVVAVVVLQTMRIRKEDALLAKAFGRKYRGYRRRTWF